jgi:hypothetical protein
MKDAERRLLEAIVERHRPDLRVRVEQLGVVAADDATIQELQLVVADELLDAGLDANGEHNAYGRQLEDLIDALSRLRPDWD